MKMSKSSFKMAFCVVGLLGLNSVSAKASVIGYLSNLVGPTDTEVSYTLTLPKFNASLGTLTGVKIYFYAQEQVTSLILTNISGSTTQVFNASATANFVSGMANSLVAADKFSASQETLTYFDTGLSSSIGNCTDNGALSVKPNQCSSLSFTPGQSVNYASTPFTFTNTDARFINDPSNVLTVGTGVQSLTGVVRNSLSPSSYIGSGNFTLTGATLNNLTLNGAGGNINFTQTTNATFQAEVDYTYTVAAVPEPGTLGLLGASLIGLVGFRKRIFNR